MGRREGEKKRGRRARWKRERDGERSRGRAWPQIGHQVVARRPREKDRLRVRRRACASRNRAHARTHTRAYRQSGTRALLQVVATGAQEIAPLPVVDPGPELGRAAAAAAAVHPDYLPGRSNNRFRTDSTRASRVISPSPVARLFSTRFLRSAPIPIVQRSLERSISSEVRARFDVLSSRISINKI